MEPEKKYELINEQGLRLDNRKFDDLRPIKIDVGVLERANGSAYIEWGKNKILVAVYGPRDAHPRHLALEDRTLFRCRYHMAPFSTEERKNPAPSRREVELSKVIRESLEPVVFTELYPRTGIDVFIEVLESEGGTRCASITAASLALADAGIPIRDMVVACAAGKVNGQVVLDLSDIEDQKGDADLPVAIIPRTGEVTLLQMDGNLTREEFDKALNLAIEGCKKIYAMQKEALKKKYVEAKEDVEAEAEEAAGEADKE